MRVVLDSDYSDFYDDAFDPSGPVIWRRRRDEEPGLGERLALAYEAGLAVVPHGKVGLLRELAERAGAAGVLVRTPGGMALDDGTAPADAEGTLLIGLPPHRQTPGSVAWVGVLAGDRRWWIRYTSGHDWNAKAGSDRTVEVHTEAPHEMLAGVDLGVALATVHLYTHQTWPMVYNVRTAPDLSDLKGAVRPSDVAAAIKARLARAAR